MHAIHALRCLVFTVALLAICTITMAQEPASVAGPLPTTQDTSLAMQPLNTGTTPASHPMPLHVAACLAGMAGIVIYNYSKRYREYVNRERQTI